MKLKYVSSNQGGQLLATECSPQEAREFYDRLWIFIHSHRGHILREYHAECKIAEVWPRNERQRVQQEDGSFVMANFYSSYFDGHGMYLGIIQHELKVQIEDLPNGITMEMDTAPASGISLEPSPE